MFVHILKHIVITILIMSLISCKGQSFKSDRKPALESLQLGTLVSELDDQIWTVFQDHNKHYWFGSNGHGVYYYDGERLINYTTEDGLIDDSIRDIQGDQYGNIFIGTPKGISKYDGSSFIGLKPIPALDNEWQLEVHDLWFNCNGNAMDLYRYDGTQLYELKLPHVSRKELDEAFATEVRGLSFKGMNSSPYSVFGIDKDRQGNLWIGTVVAGAYRYDGKSFLWFPEKELSTLPDGRVPGVRSILQDKNGYFWLSNFISKYQISESDDSVKYTKSMGIAESNSAFDDRIPYFNSGVSDKDGNLWMTTYTGGAWMYNGDTLLNFAVKDGDTEVLLVSTYKDRSGTIWLGTDNAGVYRYNGRSFEKYLPLKTQNTTR